MTSFMSLSKPYGFGFGMLLFFTTLQQNFEPGDTKEFVQFRHNFSAKTRQIVGMHTVHPLVGNTLARYKLTYVRESVSTPPME